MILVYEDAPCLDHGPILTIGQISRESSWITVVLSVQSERHSFRRISMNGLVNWDDTDQFPQPSVLPLGHCYYCTGMMMKVCLQLTPANWQSRMALLKCVYWKARVIVFVTILGQWRSSSVG